MQSKRSLNAFISPLSRSLFPSAWIAAETELKLSWKLKLQTKPASWIVLFNKCDNVTYTHRRTRRKGGQTNVNSHPKRTAKHLKTQNTNASWKATTENMHTTNTTLRERAMEKKREQKQSEHRNGGECVWVCTHLQRSRHLDCSTTLAVHTVATLPFRHLV